MKVIYKTLLTSIILLVFYCPSFAQVQKKPANLNPTFINKDKLLDSLIKAYKCKGIEFNNWDEDDNEDSCLTICLINSKKVPESHGGGTELEKVASIVKRNILNAKDYESYYVIFVKEDIIFRQKSRSHTYGGKVSSKQL